MSTFYLIRHAERRGDQDVFVGRMPGLSLTPGGRAVASRLARRLFREPIAHVWSSPLERARETAAYLATQLGLVVQVLPEITEVDAGRWTGRRFRELEASDPRRRFNTARSLTRAPGGESVLEVQARMVDAMQLLAEKFPDDGIALVSHSDPIKIAIATILGMPLDFHSRLEIDLGSVSVLRLDTYGAKLLRLNEGVGNGDGETPEPTRHP